MSGAGARSSSLQPERTLLAWRRTLLTLIVVCTIFLRWIPHFGLIALLPIMVSLAASLLIQLALNSRYRKSARGLKNERIPAPLREVVVLGATVMVLSVVGIYAVVSA
nr:putative membrane protein [uncultured bacterium]